MIHESANLEIIHVRLAAGWSETVMADIRSSVSEQSGGNCLRVYRRVGLPGDIGIHIIPSVTSGGITTSSLGLSLASELRELGMVEHSTWIEDAPEIFYNG